jgi:tRNA threonylcarbamoyladenosine biosynthesis protein TsaB
MRILAFDTTTSACSVAIWQDGKILALYYDTMVHGQAEALVPAIERTMAEAQTTYKEVDRIAVTVGPGSFTGVRVGLATARGLSVAMACPVIGLLTTQVIATEAQGSSELPIAVAIDARRAEVYLQCFTAEGTPTEDPVCLMPEDAARILGTQPWLLAGDGAARIMPYANTTVTQTGPDVANVRVLAALAAKEGLPTSPPNPVYVRPPDAIVPKNGGRLRP